LHLASELLFYVPLEANVLQVCAEKNFLQQGNKVYKAED
jgi:hypothetical protein